MIWLVFGIMAVIAAIGVMMPLFRAGAEQAGRDAYDLQVYRDQLRELADDKARGLVTADQERAARTEIERRILALSQSDGSAAPAGFGRRGRAVLAALMLVGVPGLGAWVYLAIGNPGNPDMPLSARTDIPAPGGGGDGGGGAPPGMDVEVEEAIQRLAQRLQQNPDDLGGWTLLARSYAAMGRYGDAIAAYRQALALAPEDNDLTVGLGEAMVYASADGMVSPAALRLFEAVTAREPDNPFALYYIGMANAQAGDLQRALELWTRVAETAEPDASWLPQLVAQIRSLAEELEVPPPAIAAITQATPPPPSPPAPTASPTTSPGASAGSDAPGPSAEDMAAAAEMSDAERTAMIRSMVERLAGRLAENPDDLEGWKRLANARRVLGDMEAARDAYGEVLARTPDDLNAQADYAGILVILAGTDAPIPDEAVTIYRRILEVAPDHGDALWVLGRAAREQGRVGDAVDYWSRLLVQLPPGSAEYQSLAAEIEALKQS